MQSNSLSFFSARSDTAACAGPLAGSAAYRMGIIDVPPPPDPPPPPDETGIELPSDDLPPDKVPPPRMPPPGEIRLPVIDEPASN
jgi:hypothetical protein